LARAAVPAPPALPSAKPANSFFSQRPMNLFFDRLDVLN
jgi:hypothetical protein